MIKKLCLLIFLFNPIILVHANSKLCENKMGFELADCAINIREQADKKLHQTFSRILKTQSKHERKHWEKAQKIWYQWVKFECNPNTESHFSSHVPIDIALCETHKILQREQELNEKFPQK